MKYLVRYSASVVLCFWPS